MSIFYLFTVSNWRGWSRRTWTNDVMQWM